MGGRGSSSGISYNGKPYGTEYTTLYESGNIKFIKYNYGSATPPFETMTKGRVYVTISSNDKPKFINYYDEKNMRLKQIDLSGKRHVVEGEYIIPHTHKGYEHASKGTFRLSERELKLVDRIQKIWYNKLSK